MRIKEIHFRWTGIVVLAVFIAILVKDRENEPFTTRIIHSLFYTTFYWNGCYLIVMYFRRKYASYAATMKRIITTVISISLFLVSGELFFSAFLKNEITFGEVFSNPQIVFSYLDVNFIASMIVFPIYEATYFFGQWKKTIKEAEAIKSQHLRSQYETLKDQMSPHFLFNSLNTLTNLIEEQSPQALNFTEKLSDVYRYIIQQQDKELVTLQTEINFVKAYVYLLKMRFDSNLIVNFKIPSYLNDETYVAPLTIQMLIENAIKHNVISRSSPLTINVYVEQDRTVFVKNNLQRKNNVKASTKKGLENIRRRYEFLTEKEIEVISTAQNFIVAIPLIKIYQEEKAFAVS